MGAPNQMSQYSLDDFHNFHVLGEGGMGVIYSATLGRNDVTQREFAIKEIYLLNDSVHDIDNEARTLQLVSGHKNIVSYYGVIKKRSFHYIVMEKLYGPSVFKVLMQRFVMYERESLFLMLDVFRALAFIHDRGVAHLDIKPDNVMYTSDFPIGSFNYPPAKLIDFGLSAPCKSDVISIRGTPGYIAPEILCRKRVSSYAPADIWSSGVLFYRILTGILPYENGVTEKIVLTGIARKPTLDRESRLNFVSQKTKRFILSCLSLNPEDRPSAQSAINHLASRLSKVDEINKLKNDQFGPMMCKRMVS